MPTISPGEIYLVEFDPSVGHEIQKTRPAVVVGYRGHLQHSSLLPLVPISSRISGGKPHEIVIKKDELNNLYKDSLILANQLYTYDRVRLLKKIGTISQEQYTNTMSYIKKWLGV